MEKKDANYFRIDALKILLLIIENKIAEVLQDTVAGLLVFIIIHSSLAEIIQVGRCDEQVAIVFNQLLFTEKKAQLQWMQVLSLNGLENHNFILINKNGGEKPKTWKSGLLIDPMDDRVECLQGNASKLMNNLARIIAQPDTTQIKLIDHLELCLPFQAQHHAVLAQNLERLSTILQIYFVCDWHLIWPNVKKNYPLLKEKIVKDWLQELWKVLEKKVDIHTAMVDKLRLDEINGILSQLEQHFEVLDTPSAAFFTRC